MRARKPRWTKLTKRTGAATGRPAAVTWGTALVLIGGGVLCLLLFRACGPDYEGPEARELQRLASAVPVHPGFKEVGTRTLTKQYAASISKSYTSAAGYDEIKQFYAAALSGHGFRYAGEGEVGGWWGGSEGRLVTFRRGNYFVECIAEEAPAGSDERVYSVKFHWFTA